MSDLAEALPPPLDCEEFLHFIDRLPGPENWELHDGQPYMMTGGTLAHAMIAGNIDAALRGLAKPKGCQTLRDMLVRIGPKTAFGPDVVVRCGPLSRRERYVPDPVVVFEVLSRSTMRIDRGYKLEGYRTVDSLRQFALVYQDAVRVESWTRLPTGEWLEEPDVIQERADSLRIARLGCALSVADVYDGVDL